MNVETRLSRINALALVTDEIHDVDHPAYPTLCEMLQELRKATPEMCAQSLTLRTDHGRHDQCPCGEMVDTWDQEYLSCGGDVLWGSVMAAHLPRQEG